MAQLPSPRTWTDGDLVTAGAFNADIRDGFSFFLNPPMAHVSTSISHSHRYNQNATGYGAQLVSWNIRDIDTDGMWSSNQNTRLTAQTAGWYQITLHIDWQAYNASNGGNRYASIQKNNNGGVVMGGPNEIACDMAFIKANSGEPQTNHLVAHTYLAVGDYVEAVVLNSLLNTDLAIVRTGYPWTTYFEAMWVST